MNDYSFLIAGREQSRLPRHFFLLRLRFLLLLLRHAQSQDELSVVVVSQSLRRRRVVL